MLLCVCVCVRASTSLVFDPNCFVNHVKVGSQEHAPSVLNSSSNLPVYTSFLTSADEISSCPECSQKDFTVSG